MPKQQPITLTQRFTFGPAMTALTDRRRAFVIALNNAGGKNASEAARAAGYKDANNGAIQVQAHNLLHDPNVQAAIVEDARARMVGDLHHTIDIIDAIANNPQHKDRLAAAKVKLHHAGMIEVTKTVNETTVTISLEQKLDRLKALSSQTGQAIDPSLSKLIEGEFTEVVDEDPESIQW